MNSDARFTSEQLLVIYSQNTPDQVRFGMACAKTHQKRVELVEMAIDYVIQELVQSRHHRKADGEDRLTVDMVCMLKPMGLEASHDTDVGGHCDIVIKGANNFLWLAEAKIHGSYAWDYKGFQQISTRYSTGLPGQDCGGLILYCRGQDVASVMTSWTEYLKGMDPEVDVQPCANNPLNRHSTHKHPATGLPFHIRHTPVPLYHEPQDK